jgi:hypothetical protein
MKARNNIGQASRLSHLSNQPLERSAVFEKLETGWKPVLLWLALLFCQSTGAQSYSIDWYKIAGGGGTSTGATYQVTGTIGQPDASGAMSGGSYSLTGGFWSLIAVVQTPGLPNLTITHSGNSVIVSWPDTTSCTLQTNNNLANAPGWNAYGGTVDTANGTNSITITPPVGYLFFRLAK